MVWMVLVIMAYLLGSIPTSVWAGKWFFGIDLREHGSGNAGATNAFRVLGGLTAFIVLIIDMLKGMAAVSLVRLVELPIDSAELSLLFQLGLGFAALLGHVFPVFAGFRGGKGIATLTGVAMVLFPKVVLICLAVFLIVFLTSRYVSLGSMLAAIAFPITLILLPGGFLISELVFSLLIAVFVPLTHLKNIRRLVKGEENKISFSKNR